MPNGKKAKMRGPVVDPIPNMSGDHTAHSNQVKMSGPAPNKPTPTAMKNAGKRKIGIPLPLSYT